MAANGEGKVLVLLLALVLLAACPVVRGLVLN